MPLFWIYVTPANENILFTSFSSFTSNQTILIYQMVTCATAHDDVVLSIDDSRLLLSLWRSFYEHYRQYDPLSVQSASG